MDDAIRNARAGGLQSAEPNTIADLRDALRERLAIIHDEESRRDEARHLDRLRVVSEKIDKLQAALPERVDPRLAHYLQRRSYDKALEFIESL
jgi:hypothetical protein